MNDANLVMFRHVLAAVDPAAAKQALDFSRRLHLATTVDREQTLAVARALRAQLLAWRDTTTSTEFPADSLGVILGSLVADAERGEFLAITPRPNRQRWRCSRSWWRSKAPDCL